MPMDFRMGTLIAFIFFVNFHLCVLSIYVILNRAAPNFPFILSIVLWTYIAVVAVANIRAFRNIENINDSNLNEKTFGEQIKDMKIRNILRIYLGNQSRIALY
jgi:membrane protein implicated in regulation of membrane protease activity